MNWNVRPVQPGDYITAGTEVVVSRRSKSRPHLGSGLVIECGNQVAGVLRGHTLIYFHEEHGVMSEIVGSSQDAVDRMKELLE